MHIQPGLFTVHVSILNSILKRRIHLHRFVVIIGGKFLFSQCFINRTEIAVNNGRTLARVDMGRFLAFHVGNPPALFLPSRRAARAE